MRIAAAAPTPPRRRKARTTRAEPLVHGLELHLHARSPQRLELHVRRSAEGRVAVQGTCAPADTYVEVEVCAGFERAVALVDAKGAFSLPELPGTAKHVKVTLRGGPLPPIVLTRVPVAD